MKRMLRYKDLIETPLEDLETDEDRLRKKWCEALPKSVVASITASVNEKQKEIIRLSREVDELLDFVEGWFYVEKAKAKPENGGDAE